MDEQWDRDEPTGISGVSAPRDLSLERSVRPLIAALRRITGVDVAFLTEIIWDQPSHEATAADGADLPWHTALARRALGGGEVTADGVGRWVGTPGGDQPDSQPTVPHLDPSCTVVSRLVVLDDPARPWGILGAGTAGDQPLPDGHQRAVAEFAELIAQRIRDHHAQQDEHRAAARDRATLARHSSVLLAAERELLAPLTAARGWASTVLRPDLDPDRRSEAGRGLVAQLDVLWNRLNVLWTEGHLAVEGPVDLAVIDLAATVRATLARQRAVLGSHDLHVDADEPVEALGDVDVVADLLSRLLDNVNLHTPISTRVEITVHPDPPRVIVRDHGPGWPKPLPRAPLSTSRPLPLAGTGLFAATGMAESIGASLQAIDVDGPGAALQLTLAAVEDVARWGLARP